MEPEKGGKSFEKPRLRASGRTSYAQVEETVAKLAAGLVAITGLGSATRCSYSRRRRPTGW